MGEERQKSNIPAPRVLLFFFSSPSSFLPVKIRVRRLNAYRQGGKEKEKSKLRPQKMQVRSRVSATLPLVGIASDRAVAAVRDHDRLLAIPLG